MHAGLANFWNDIISIDHNTVMPNLEEIVLIHIRSRAESANRLYDETCEPELKAEEWPTTVEGPRMDNEFSGKARKLTLDLEDKEIHLLPLKSLAPKISSLTHTSALTIDAAPLAEIWACWPGLAELKVNFGYKYPGPRRNHDAAFCGIYEEEVQLLMAQTDEYLQAVNIVPVRPSVTTMLSTLGSAV